MHAHLARLNTIGQMLLITSFLWSASHSVTPGSHTHRKAFVVLGCAGGILSLGVFFIRRRVGTGIVH